MFERLAAFTAIILCSLGRDSNINNSDNLHAFQSVKIIFKIRNCDIIMLYILSESVAENTI